MQYNLQTKIKLAKDKEENWRIKNPVLLDGELVISDTCDGINIKIGNGFSNYNDLPFLLQGSNHVINSIQEIYRESSKDDFTYKSYSKRMESDYPILNIDLGSIVFRSEIPNTDFDKIYPVGSVYASTSDTDPYFLFHIGSWEYITKETLYPKGSIFGIDIHIWRRLY